ncbi:MAG: response regulator [Acidobacteriota bacterium]
MKGAKSESLPAARILLVDDNKLGLIARKALLEDLGYRITTALEGQEAFERFGREKFDLVITDYKMPRMNGLELIAKIREKAGDVPIILISGYAEALGMTEENTGASAVICKSANEVPHMVRSVNRLLKRTPKKPAGSSHRVQLSRPKRQSAS